MNLKKSTMVMIVMLSTYSLYNYSGDDPCYWTHSDLNSTQLIIADAQTICPTLHDDLFSLDQLINLAAQNSFKCGYRHGYDQGHKNGFSYGIIPTIICSAYCTANLLAWGYYKCRSRRQSNKSAEDRV